MARPARARASSGPARVRRPAAKAMLTTAPIRRLHIGCTLGPGELRVEPPARPCQGASQELHLACGNPLELITRVGVEVGPVEALELAAWRPLGDSARRSGRGDGVTFSDDH